MVRAYPQARYVVTTRPSAVEEDWLAGSGFVPFDLLPNPAGLSEAQAASLVRTAALIGGEAARTTKRRIERTGSAGGDRRQVQATGEVVRAASSSRRNAMWRRYLARTAAM